MKKIILSLLVLVIPFFMAACGGSIKTPEPTEPSAAPLASAPLSTPAPETVPRIVKVGVCIYKFDDSFMTIFRNEFETYLPSLSTKDVKYECTIVDGQDDPRIQSEQINTFVNEKYDVILVDLVQVLSAPDIIEITKKAEIPTMFVAREPEADSMKLWDKITFVGSDALHMQTPQGEIIAGLPDKGDINGDGVINYIHIMGGEGCIDVAKHTLYAIKAMEAGGMKVTRLVEERGEWSPDKAYEITAAALAEYGDKIEVVVCNSDGMAPGALRAIKEAGRTVGKDIYIISIGGNSPEILELIENGEFTGTVRNDAAGQARKAAEVAIDAADGKPLEKYYMVDWLKIVGQ